MNISLNSLPHTFMDWNCWLFKKKKKRKTESKIEIPEALNIVAKIHCSIGYTSSTDTAGLQQPFNPQHRVH